MKFIQGDDIRRSIKIGIDALNDLDLWEWLSAFTLYNDIFVMRKHENLDKIEEYMSDHGDIRSGASFGLIMRTLQMIAKYGWSMYVDYYTNLLSSGQLFSAAGDS